MGGNVTRQQRRASQRKAAKVTPPPFDFAQARLVNSLLNAAGFKGSEAKQLAATVQAQLEAWHPELLADNNE